MDIIIFSGIAAMGVILLAWWVGKKFGQDDVAADMPQPANRLEELLVAAVDSDGSPELTAELKRATLVVPCYPDGTIATIGFTYPPEFADDDGDYEVDEDGQIVISPRVLCYSSRALVECLQCLRYPQDVIRFLVDGGGTWELSEFPAKEVFAFALSKGLEVRLYPFGGITRQFSREELEELIAPD